MSFEVISVDDGTETLIGRIENRKLKNIISSEVHWLKLDDNGQQASMLYIKASNNVASSKIVTI